MTVTQYVGARYVPVFADPAEWTNTKQYEPLTIVLHQGNSFTSKQFVPVGVDINDTNYWAETGNYNAQVEAYREEVVRFTDSIQEKAFCFNTVAEMKASPNLFAGALCRTNGFYDSGDGGGAWYTISSSGTANEMDILACSNNLYAKLVLNEYVSLRVLGAIGNGIANDSSVFTRAIDIAMDKEIAIFVPTGTYLLNTNVFQTASRPRAYNNFTIKGEGKYQSILKLNNSTTDQYFFNSTVRELYNRINCYEIGFTGNTIDACGFYVYSAGNEKQFRFYNCYFKLSKVLYCAGTGNSDLHRFYDCIFETYGDAITLDNNQSVDTELYGCAGLLRGSLVKQITGGCFNVFGGAFDCYGIDGTYAFDCSSASTGIGNRGIFCTGTRFEFHNGQKFIDATGKKAVELTFTNCNFGSVDALPSGYYSTIYKNACVYFNNCTFSKNLTFYVYTDSAFFTDSPTGAVLVFKDCSGNEHLYNYVTVNGTLGRVICDGYIHIPTTGAKYAEDFDINFMQNSTNALTAKTKIFVFKKQNDNYPKAGSYFEAKLPPNAYIKRIYLFRPAIAGVNTTYQLHVGTHDESTVYTETPQGSLFRDEIKLDVSNIGFIEDGILRVWATGEATNVTSQGYAYVEYI